MDPEGALGKIYDMAVNAVVLRVWRGKLQVPSQSKASVCMCGEVTTRD